MQNVFIIEYEHLLNIILILPPFPAHLKLSPYILHWEPADYEPVPIKSHRNAREVNAYGQRPLKFAFRAHGR